MYLQQTCALFFFPKRNKADQAGLAPIYARIIIDGQRADRAVNGVKVHPDHWDTEAKLVKPDHPKAKAYNKKLVALLTDVFRGIDLVCTDPLNGWTKLLNQFRFCVCYQV
jgi:hypothetical protein